MAPHHGSPAVRPRDRGCAMTAPYAGRKAQPDDARDGSARSRPLGRQPSWTSTLSGTPGRTLGRRDPGRPDRGSLLVTSHLLRIVPSLSCAPWWPGTCRGAKPTCRLRWLRIEVVGLVQDRSSIGPVMGKSSRRRYHPPLPRAVRD